MLVSWIAVYKVVIPTVNEASAITAECLLAEREWADPSREALEDASVSQHLHPKKPSEFRCMGRCVLPNAPQRGYLSHQCFSSS